MKPGIKTIIAGVTVFLLGAFVFPLLLILPLFLGESTELQFKVPGQAEVSVKDPGRYYLWNDFRTVHEGKSYNRSVGIPDGMEIRVLNSNGEALEFISDTSITSSSGSSSKNSIGYVEVENPGQLRVEVSGGNEERIFSFSQSKLLKIFGLILGGGAISVLIALIGIGLSIWGIVKLVKSNRSGGPSTPPNSGSASSGGNLSGAGEPPSLN